MKHLNDNIQYILYEQKIIYIISDINENSDVIENWSYTDTIHMWRVWERRGENRGEERVGMRGTERTGQVIEVSSVIGSNMLCTAQQNACSCRDQLADLKLSEVSWRNVMRSFLSNWSHTSYTSMISICIHLLKLCLRLVYDRDWHLPFLWYITFVTVLVKWMNHLLTSNSSDKYSQEVRCWCKCKLKLDSVARIWAHLWVVIISIAQCTNCLQI